MKKLCKFNCLILFLFVNIYIFNLVNHTFATENIPQINLNIVDRLARLEEGQKAIIIEMRTRFESTEKRFEAINKRFEAIDKRFESIIREMNHRFESVDKRIDQLANQINHLANQVNQIGNYIIALIGMIITIFLAIIGYAIWERKTQKEKTQEKSKKLIFDQNQYEQYSHINDHNKLNQVLDIMKKMSEKSPEMKDMMHAAQLL